MSMMTIDLNKEVVNTGSNEQGDILYNHLVEALNKKESVKIIIDNGMSLSSSFLNSSFGRYLETHGFETFRQNIRFVTTKNQFSRIKKYISLYKELYLD